MIPALLVLSLLAPLQTTVQRTTVHYISGDGVSPLPMDIYTPASTPLGAVIAIHGGRWSSGGKSSMIDVCQHLAVDGFLCAAPNYRLAPTYPFPAALNDLIQAVAYIESQYGFSTVRGFGASAGGNLAAMLDGLGYVSMAAVWSAPTDLTTIRDCACWQAVHDYAPTPEARHDASPVFFVSGPMLIANSDAEQIPLTQAYEMRDALDAAGIAWQLDVIPGTRHGLAYFTQEWPSTRIWLEGS